jgi:4-hydroxybenzoate polyprenyltransferase
MVPLNPWFWISVIVVILFYAYILKRIRDVEEKEFVEFMFSTRELSWKIPRSTLIEAVGWLTMVTGFIGLAYSILNFFSQESLVVTILGSCFVVGGYFLASHYRKRRSH